MGGFTLLFVSCLLFSISRTTMSLHTIFPNQFMGYNDTLSSDAETFELGFFSLGDSFKNHYLGIRYKKFSSETVAWVANRKNPLINKRGILKFTDQGILVLCDGNNKTVWSSNTSTTAQEPVVQLLESGNLVVKEKNDSDPANYLWQSFDYPGNTMLPGMKIGRNLVTGFEWCLSSWKSIDDPTPGQFSLRIDPRGVPQLILMKGSQVHIRLGSWNGFQFTGTQMMLATTVLSVKFVLRENEVYLEHVSLTQSALTRYIIDTLGQRQFFISRNQENDWEVYRSPRVGPCDNYAECGAYASCNEDKTPICSCLEGFVSRTSRNSSDTCERRTPLSCDHRDGFFKYSQIKLPDTSSAWVNRSMSLKECRELCLKNCSCRAYTNSDITGEESGCLIYYGDLIDMTQLPYDGQDLFIRLAASEIAQINGKTQSKRKKLVAIIVSFGIVAMVVSVLGLVLCIRKKRHRKKGTMEEMDLPIYDLITIINATDNFSSRKKLGEGGFGSVYKGELMDGKEIAVKRLSRTSIQGLEELKNEVTLIAKLQHRNLVKVLGCCIKRDEKLLVYEYMPNKSLDHFIFDETKSKLLDWKVRLDIIFGIARGILYLHQDSRSRIIHRDLKASNVLLDNQMNPKISDFGMARLCGEGEYGERTERVVGTYGYMSPEYASHGLFSVKSDIFSFGVLVIEIVSGKRNKEFLDREHDRTLLGHAWKLLIEERSSELLDSIDADSSDVRKVLRCIHVGLLCVQQRPEDRPNMSSVVLMLGSEDPLPLPKQPGFFTEEIRDATYSSNKYNSENMITITYLEAR